VPSGKNPVRCVGRRRVRKHTVEDFVERCHHTDGKKARYLDRKPRAPVAQRGRPVEAMTSTFNPSRANAREQARRVFRGAAATGAGLTMAKKRFIWSVNETRNAKLPIHTIISKTGFTTAESQRRPSSFASALPAHCVDL